MKSKAAIGGRPIHPALVTIPIGAFVLALIGDIVHSFNGGVVLVRFRAVRDRHRDYLRAGGGGARVRGLCEGVHERCAA